LVTANPDKLFAKVSAANPLTAVGGREYFQTALLILRPRLDIFLDLYLEYRYGEFGYNQWRARDGILFRNCLLKMHDNVGHPTDRLYHFYGYIKPWFNKDAKHHSKDPLVFDENYAIWWGRYEYLHITFFEPMEHHKEHGLVVEHSSPLLRQERWKGIAAFPYGNSALTNKKNPLPLGIIDRSLALESGANPRDYMWLQRFSVGSEYLRPTSYHTAVLRNITVNPNASLNICPQHSSCDECCSNKGSGWRCSNEWLNTSRVNDCRFAYDHRLAGFKCRQCDFLFESNAAPAVDGEERGSSGETSYRCWMPFMHSPSSYPVCSAVPVAAMRRVCPCVSDGPTKEIEPSIYART
jgi:hypothetical protein